MFSNAHEFLIKDSTMVNVNIERAKQYIQTLDSGMPVLTLLEQKRVTGAEVDSSDRSPARCHPSTRKELRERIHAWIANPSRDWNMFWLLGPAGVGKSAVAQTIAEECKANSRLGATFFFSRPNRRNDPSHVIPTLAHQLAVQSPDYKKLITQRLANDSTILEKNIRTQSKELIVEPFKVLRGQKSFQHPLLIILDGLDECKGRDAQCEFVQLISSQVGVRESPLLWMICSRPEWHLQRMLSNGDFGISCCRDGLVVDDEEAQRDVYRFLQDGFQDIRRRFYDLVADPWPAAAHIRQLAHAASGLFIFASTLLKFIGDEYHGNPISQLAICLKFVGNTYVPGAVNPLHALDLLYKRILTDLPTHFLPTIMCIISLRVLYERADLSACVGANILGLDRASFYAALQWMHSVLRIPIPEQADRQGVHFYHASFEDFLRDQNRSGHFHDLYRKAHYDVATNSLRWYNAFTSTECCRDGNTCAVPLPPLTWLPMQALLDLESTSGNREDQSFLLQRIRNVVASTSWAACCLIANDDIPGIIAELRRFCFCHLTPFVLNDRQFIRFLNWLRELETAKDLLRHMPTSFVDLKLLWKNKFRISSHVFPIQARNNVEIISIHLRNKPSKEEEICAFFLGFKKRSCIVRILRGRWGRLKFRGGAFSVGTMYDYEQDIK